MQAHTRPATRWRLTRWCRGRAAAAASSEAGQALVFGALTLFMLAATVIFVADAGMVTSTRIQVQNAADECAYAGSLYEANVISAVAYLNEAMAYLYYDGIRYAADTTMLGVLASLKKWGPPYPSDSRVYEDDDSDPPLYSGNPIDNYDLTYDRAKEWVPQIESTLSMFARWEWGMSLACGELLKMEIERTALKHRVEAVALYPDVDFFPGSGTQFDLHILKLMENGEHVGWRVWSDDPPFYVEAKRVGPFHWFITSTDGTTYEIKKIGDNEYYVRTPQQEITVKMIDDEHVKLKIIDYDANGGTTETFIDAKYLDGLGWAVAMSNSDYDVTYAPMAGGGYWITVQDNVAGTSGSAGVRRGPDGFMEQWDGSNWVDVPGQSDSVNVNGVDIPVQIDNRITLGPDTWFRVPNELHLRNITYLIPNVFQLPNCWITLADDYAIIDAFINIQTAGGSRRLRFTIDENDVDSLTLYGLLGYNYKVPDSADCRWHASSDGRERDRLCRDCQLNNGQCDSPADEETEWTYQYRRGFPYFIKEDLRRFGHHAICDRDVFALNNNYQYPQWAEWYDIGQGQPRGGDYYQTRPQWGAPANYDSDGDGTNDSVRIYASDTWGLNSTPDRGFDPYFQKVKPWTAYTVGDRVGQFAPPLRLSEDFFFYALTVGCWRSHGGHRTSPLTVFRNPSWGVVGAASARAGFLELRSDDPADTVPNYRFTWPTVSQIEQHVSAGYENLYEPVWTAHLWPVTDAIRDAHLDAYVDNQTGLSYLLNGLMHTTWYKPRTPDQIGEERTPHPDLPGALGGMGVNWGSPGVGDVIEH